MPRSRLRSFSCALALLVVVFALYGRALGHGLVSDDFLLFAQVENGPLAALAYHGSYHWYPLGQLVLWLQQALAGDSGAGHHTITLGLFWLLGLATVGLGRRLGFSEPVAWAGGLLLLTSVLPFEVPLWAIGSLYSVSALLAIGAFRAYLRLVESPGFAHQAGFLALYAAAFLTHEQALGVPLAAVAWSVWVEKERSLVRLGLRFLPAVGLVLVYIGLKFALTDGTALLPGLELAWVKSLGRTVFHSLRVLLPVFPSDFVWALLRPPAGPWALAFVAVVVGLIWRRLDGRERFLTLWGLGQVALMTVAIGLASRHYALPLIPIGLLWASLLARASRERRGLFAVLVALVALGGALQVPAKVVAWGRASQAAERILADVERAAVERPVARYLLTIDLPDGLPQGEAEPAYIFRLGFEDAVRGRLPGRFLDFERRVTEPRKSWVEPYGRPISAVERAALAENPEVLVLYADGPEAGLRLALP
ncbi:MAG: hypothetical protein SF066_04865 [Thermoanaerobaculia bacterium]|nr:hypothetical protein [Thermoanaerobaculia bacterium]